MNHDLKIIKKNYGEDMMRFCRENFSSILEEEGKLSKIFLERFYPNKSFLSDIMDYHNSAINFINYVNDLAASKPKDKIITDKSFEELMNEAGYDVYECKCEEDIQQFKKYYDHKEELCTFNGGRLDRCYVYFAVKHNVDEIKRENFLNPLREDEYGTSVISIQVSKLSKVLSIKNRYNHAVVNPDATFLNDLDNIIPGLTYAFEQKLGFEIYSHSLSKSFFLPGAYANVSDGKMYKYNYEINGNYICPDNIVIEDYIPKQYDKADYILVDFYLINLKDKEISLVDYYNEPDYTCFPKHMHKFKSIKVIKENGKKYVIFNDGEIIMKVDNLNRLVGYTDYITENLEDNFLKHAEYLKYINMPNAKKIGDSVLECAIEIKSINFPKVESIGNNFMKRVNAGPKEVKLPECKLIGIGFLSNVNNVQKVHLPKAYMVGYNTLDICRTINELEITKNAYECVLQYNDYLEFWQQNFCSFEPIIIDDIYFFGSGEEYLKKLSLSIKQQ